MPDIFIVFLLTIIIFSSVVLFMVRHNLLPSPLKQVRAIEYNVDAAYHDQELLKEMKELAFPKPDDQIQTRNVSTWNRSPIIYDKKIKSALEFSSLPQ
jgi:hypothetical protein